MSGVDTSAAAVEAFTAAARKLADHEDGVMLRPGAAEGWRWAYRLVAALAAERDALRAALTACERERDAARVEHLDSLEVTVREGGYEDADGRVDSMAQSAVAEAMYELADAGRMILDGEGFGRRVFARWAHPPAAPADEVGP